MYDCVYAGVTHVHSHCAPHVCVSYDTEHSDQKTSEASGIHKSPSGARKFLVYASTINIVFQPARKTDRLTTLAYSCIQADILVGVGSLYIIQIKDKMALFVNSDQK